MKSLGEGKEQSLAESVPPIVVRQGKVKPSIPAWPRKNIALSRNQEFFWIRSRFLERVIVGLSNSSSMYSSKVYFLHIETEG